MISQHGTEVLVCARRVPSQKAHAITPARHVEVLGGLEEPPTFKRAPPSGESPKGPRNRSSSSCISISCSSKSATFASAWNLTAFTSFNLQNERSKNRILSFVISYLNLETKLHHQPTIQKRRDLWPLKRPRQYALQFEGSKSIALSLY